jgi:hypothetical protein
VPRNKLGQAGGYQHLPRQLGESFGETGVVTMFTAIVLTTAGAAGLQTLGADQPAPAPVAAVATAAPVVGRPTPIPIPLPGQRVAAPTTALVAAGDAADDGIIEVADNEGPEMEHGLSQAVTMLPAEVQMNGYRLMWGLAGVIALAGAGISWFMRDEEADDSAMMRARAAPVRQPAPAPAAPRPVAAAPFRPRLVNGTAHRPYVPRTRGSTTVTRRRP